MHSIERQWTAKSHLELSCKVGFSLDIMCRAGSVPKGLEGCGMDQEKGMGLILAGDESSAGRF